MSDFLLDGLGGLDALLEEGARFYAAQPESEALREYQRALDTAPRDRAALIGLAETLHHLGRLEEALDTWQRVIAVVPGQAEAYVNQGDVLYELRRYEDALTRYTRALQLAPNNALAYKQAGRALLRLARYEDALDAFGRAARLAPDDLWILIGLGLALEALGRRDQALSAYTRVLQVDPGSVEVTVRAGRLLLRQSATRQAQKLARQMLARNARNQGAWLVQGEALMAVGSYEGALSSFDQAIQLAPKDPRGYQGKSRALACLGRHKEADVVLRQARALEK
jgi:tetratricopeptide (TPR) repeat protein